MGLWGEDVKSEGTSKVTWEIEPVGDSCRLTVTHSELVRRGHDQRLERDNRLGTGFYGDIADDLDLADHLACPLRSPRCRSSTAGQDRAGSVLGIDRVGPATLTTVATIRPSSFENLNVVASQIADEALAIATRAFDPETLRPPSVLVHANGA